MRISTVYAMLFLIGVGGCDGREEAVQRDVQRNRRQREATRPTTNTFNGKVIKVKDGDSIVVLRDKEQIEVRLRDIDYPELAQSFGRQAKKLVADLCLREPVSRPCVARQCVVSRPLANCLPRIQWNGCVQRRQIFPLNRPTWRGYAVSFHRAILR